MSRSASGQAALAVTGTNGFVGWAFQNYASNAGYSIHTLARGMAPPLVDTVVHVAGLAHSDAPLQDFMTANFALTLELARKAQAAGVRRFVFVSTINVVAGHREAILSADLPYKPLSGYGVSKAEAEKALLALGGIEIVVLRPPLVFGPGVRGNLRSLMKLCASGLPLPFASVTNRRSMIGITNLCDALLFLATADQAKVAGRVFHIAEAAPFSLSQIIRTCRAEMGRSPRLFSAPPSMLGAAARLAGKGKLADQLFGDLLVDCSSLLAAGWRRQDTAASDMANMARAS